MDNFRRRNRDSHRQAMDGIMNAPVRSYNVRQPQGRRRVQTDGLRPTTGRRLDDFKRSEGLHSVSSGAGGVRASIGGSEPLLSRSGQAAQKASLLHRTLPNGGMFKDTRKKQKGDRKQEAKQGKAGRLRTVRKWTLRTALVVTVLTLLIGGFLIFKGILKLNKVFQGGGAAAALNDEVTPELLKGEGDGRVNILLLGRGGAGHEGADLTDTIILASIDPLNKTTTLVSIPRDLWVTQQGYGSSKVNAVFANAKYRSLNTDPKNQKKADREGAHATQQVVSQVLGIPIHYYSLIDFRGFKKAVDVVGGVDINVPEDLAVQEHLWDSVSGRNYFLNVPAGQQHFDSTKALYFTRSRHTSVRGDFDRAERQRLFIGALAKKVTSAGTYTNPVKVSNLMSAFGDHLSTDLSLNNALRLMEISKGMDFSKLKSIGLADPPNNFVRTDNVNGLSIVRPTAGLGDYSQIQNYIRNALKDPYISKENARIAVLNGTITSGLATTKANQLKSYGYNVTVIDTAPTQDYAQTLFIDLTGGKKPFTKSYLEKRLGVKATTRLPDANISSTNIDFVVILGQSN